MNTAAPTRRSQPSEEGYILVAVIFMLALLMIALSVAAPKIAKEIQRDRELETMHRGKQYIRAIKLYYTKFNAYPPNVDALVKTNEIRFLRKKYIDPTTGKDEWKVIHLGQNKAPTAFGFFGVPLGGAGMGGGLCGNALPNSTGSNSSSFGSGSSIGAGSSFGSSSSFGSGVSTPAAGCPPSGASASASQNTAGSTTDPNAANGASASGSQAASGTASGTGTDTGNGAGQNGQTFGGAGVMGVSPNSPKPSILVYKKKSHYNEWEFVYDPIAEQMLQQGALAGGGNNGLTPNGIPGGPAGGGSSIGGSGFGAGSGFGGGSTSGSNGIGSPGGAITPAPLPQQPQQ
jgi:type II secretory pathway pseudopilin PulG